MTNKNDIPPFLREGFSPKREDAMGFFNQTPSKSKTDMTFDEFPSKSKQNMDFCSTRPSKKEDC